ncbi:very short patch repair endonuclease [Streptomyces sp. NRRL F-5630]|uniref:very short patch repair endonuclease n=1 Tax=Streptomyces sp. NRRL F-5630 TaxID=1463864 RepID=UPI003EBD4AC9
MARVPDLPLPSSVDVSRRMSRQRSRDTDPERAVRRLVHAAGFRYRLQVRVPGLARRTMDFGFPRERLAVFMDGCFWHGCPEHATSPRSNAAWWREKLDRNMARDAETTAHLHAQGWTVLRFWEHEAPEHAASVVIAALRRRRGEHPDRPSP